jgi:heme exporter protein CcmD
MSFLDLPHIGFVVASYAVALVVAALLIGMVWRDYRSLRRALAAREAKGASLAEAEPEPR